MTYMEINDGDVIIDLDEITRLYVHDKVAHFSDGTYIRLNAQDVDIIRYYLLLGELPKVKTK